MPYEQMTITQLLEQKKMWQCADGMPIRVKAMEPSHRRNTLAFLRRRARSLYDHHFWHYYAMAPDDVFDQALEESPERWLERQPLTKRLAKLVEADEREAANADATDLSEADFWEVYGEIDA